MSAAPESIPANRVSAVAGLVLLFGGAALMVWPAATTRVLASLVGLGAVTYGVRELSRVFAGGGDGLAFSAGMIGLFNIFGGFVIILTPFVSATAVGTVIGIAWLVTGVAEVAGALLQPDARLERLLIGVVSASAGVLVLVLPAPSVVVLVWIAGAWMIAAGAVLLSGRAAGAMGRARPA